MTPILIHSKMLRNLTIFTMGVLVISVICVGDLRPIATHVAN
jgi:hypothetical protein